MTYQTPIALRFNFWGTRLHLRVPSLQDKQHFEYYFEDFLESEAPGADIYIRLSSSDGVFYTPDRPEIKAPFKTIEIKTAPDARYRMYDTYTTEPTKPTCIPPLFMKPLADHFTVSHASAVSLPGDTFALAIHGPSGSGKSSLALELIRQNSFGFVTDDLLIQRQGCVYPFTRPISLRDQTYAHFNVGQTLKGISTYVPKALNTDYGLAQPVHPRSLGLRVAENPLPLAGLVELRRAKRFGAQTETANHLIIELDVDKHLDTAANAIAETWRLS